MSKRDDHYIPRTNKIKLLVLGDAGIFYGWFHFKIAVGKTSVTRNFTRSTFEQNYISTLGIDYETRRFNVDGEDVSLQVFSLLSTIDMGHSWSREVSFNYKSIL